MGDPKIVYRIIAWEMNGPYLFTALLKVSCHLIFLQGMQLSDKKSESLGASIMVAYESILAPMLLHMKVQNTMS